MMDNLEDLSDAELFRTAMSCGFPSVPITETTRGIIIKKLRRHYLNVKQLKKVTNKRDRQSAAATAPPLNIARNSIHDTLSLNESMPKPIYERLDFAHLQNGESSFTGRPSLYAAPTQIMPRNVPMTSTEFISSAPNYNNNFRQHMPAASRSNTDWLNDRQNEYNKQHSGIVKKLLSFRDVTLGKQALPTTKAESTIDNVEVSFATKYENKRRQPTITSQKIISYLLSYINRRLGLKQAYSYVPHFLIAGLVAFFAVLLFTYIYNRPDLGHANEQYTVCKEHDLIIPTTKVFCIQSAQLEKTMEFKQQLLQLLQSRAMQHFCVNESEPDTVASHELLPYIKSDKFADRISSLNTALDLIEYLVQHNPNWHVEIKRLEDATDVIGFEKYTKIRNMSFSLKKPSLPLKCILRIKMRRFFSLVGVGVITAAVFVACYAVVRYIKNRKNDRLAAVNQLTTAIINELIYQASTQKPAEPQDEIIVNHLRDKLLPLNKRANLLWAWNEALRLLENSDSRVQFGVTMRNGEQFRTIKWSGSNPKDINRDVRFSKNWQSPAFANANKIANPPTPCLKIRHMFSSSDINLPNLENIIETAILEKVGSQCVIKEFKLDKQSCCVYVRCASEADAGIVHNEINGWWFENRLVSIKFLRLQRYLERFPQSS